MKKTIKLKKTYPVLKKKSLKPFKCLFFRTLIFTATTFKDIPVKIMVSSIHIYSQVLTNIFNNCVKSGNFPDILKYADTTPVIKKGFHKNALTFIQSYFTNRHQRTKVGDKFSKWQKISTGVPQGSILGPLFFNIFINDPSLFIETTTLCNYADDNTVCSSDKNSNLVISKLKHDLAIILEWFYENYMVHSIQVNVIF